MFKKSTMRIIIGFLTSAFLAPAQAALDVSGYFDMEYISVKDSNPYFRQHHLNLLLQHSVENYKFMAEIEFEDAVDLDYGRTPVTSNTKAKTGRLFVERAWGEVSWSPWANLRVGQLLHSSYYYQNHYPSITVNFTDPSTRKKIFNYNIKGARLWGEAGGIYYDLWSGRGPVASSTTGTADPDNEQDSEMGGKIGYTFKLANGSVVLSYMYGQYANDIGQPKDTATGVELIANIGKFTLWSEFGNRKEGTTNSTAHVAASYFIGSYGFDLANGAEIIPFVMWDSLKENDTQTDAKVRQAVGLSYRPIPTITYKAEYISTPSYKTSSTTTVADTNQTTLAFIYFYN